MASNKEGGGGEADVVPGTNFAYTVKKDCGNLNKFKYAKGKKYDDCVKYEQIIKPSLSFSSSNAI